MHNAIFVEGGFVMLSIPILLQPLKKHIKRSSVSNPSLESVEGILLLDADTPLSVKHVYIGSPENIVRAIGRLPGEHPITLMSWLSPQVCFPIGFMQANAVTL